MAIENVYDQSKNNVVELCNEIKKVKKEFARDGLLTVEEIGSIIKRKVTDVSEKDAVVQ